MLSPQRHAAGGMAVRWPAGKPPKPRMPGQLDVAGAETNGTIGTIPPRGSRRPKPTPSFLELLFA